MIYDRTSIKDLNEEVLCYAIKNAVNFSVRKNLNAKSSDRGLWFYGTERSYFSISWWVGFNNYLKICNISLCMDTKGSNSIYAFMTASKEPDKFHTIAIVATAIGAVKDEKYDNSWRKTYKQYSDGKSSSFLDELRKFYSGDREVINLLLSSIDNPRLIPISKIKYQDEIDKVNKVRVTLGLDELMVSSGNTSGSQIKDAGVMWKNEAVYFKTIDEANLIVEPVHSRLQNILAEQLRSEFVYANVRLEVDGVDVVMETNSEIILYEVKPFDDPIKCIQTGLGQLMVYYARFQKKNSTKKRLKIRIVGVKALSELQHEHVDIISKALRVDFDYIIV